MTLNKPLPDAQLLLLLAVLLPPSALDLLGGLIAEHTVDTPWGTVGPLALRELPGGPPVWVQPYTGLPTRTDPRATVMAAHALGVRRILAWDQAVAVNRALSRGQPVVVRDFVDLTRHQPLTLTDQPASPVELVPGVSGDPGWVPIFCPQMRAILHARYAVAEQAVYLGVDGPHRETPAEAAIYRQWGIDVVGQNLVPEVSLAAELGLCFGGLVTIHATSSDQHVEPVDGQARAGLEQVIESLPPVMAALAMEHTCDCGRERQR